MTFFGKLLKWNSDSVPVPVPVPNSYSNPLSNKKTQETSTNESGFNENPMNADSTSMPSSSSVDNPNHVRGRSGTEYTFLSRSSNSNEPYGSFSSSSSGLTPSDKLSMILEEYKDTNKYLTQEEKNFFLNYNPEEKNVLDNFLSGKTIKKNSEYKDFINELIASNKKKRDKTSNIEDKSKYQYIIKDYVNLLDRIQSEIKQIEIEQSQRNRVGGKHRRRKTNKRKRRQTKKKVRKENTRRRGR
jgi:hypothetical protein